MSDYQGKAYSPTTGEVENVLFRDDYYGPHKYGVEFASGVTYPIEGIRLADNIDMEPADLQMVMLSLSRLQKERPGWEYAIGLVAEKFKDGKRTLASFNRISTDDLAARLSDVDLFSALDVIAEECDYTYDLCSRCGSYHEADACE